jgi:outer membrane receptor protein involved in Fe transport
MMAVKEHVKQGRGLRAPSPRGSSRALAGGILLAVAQLAALAHAQEPPKGPQPRRCQLVGRIAVSGNPLPGVALTLALPGGGEVGTSSTAADGSYLLVTPAPGTYVLRANLAGFADITREVTLSEETCAATADIEMVLRSRAPAPTAVVPQAAPTPVAAAQPQPSGVPADRRAGALRERFRALGVVPGGAPGTQQESAAEGTDASVQSLLPPGFSPDAPTEAVALTGAQVQTVDGVLFRDRMAMLDEVGGDLDALAQRMRQWAPGGGMGPPPDFAAGGPGGPGPGPGFGGGFRGGAGPGGGFRDGAGGMGRGDRLQGSLFYNLGDSAFDASPYPLNGPSQKKAYSQQRLGATIGGPVKIPGVYDGTSRTSFVLAYMGNHSQNPQDTYSTVPTASEREGDLAAFGRTIVDPTTGIPFTDNVIPASRIDPSARALLALIPLPNQPGATQNYHYATTTTSSNDQISLRLIHSFGSAGRGDSTADRRTQRAAGGRSGRERRPTISIGVTYRVSTQGATTNFPTLGGSTHVTSWDVPVSVSFTMHHVFNQLRFDFNRNQSDSRNLYANSINVAQQARISGVSSDPFDWGAPNLSFTTLSGLRDPNPSSRLNQRIALGDTMTATLGRHTLRWGGEYRDLHLDSQSDANARGSFVFTGLYTAAVDQDGQPEPGTGLDFADFLLGLPQQASVAYGPGRVRFRGHSWSAFVQDDWRLRSNLTLNLGLRYEYVSPFTEANGQLVNLDVAPGFTGAKAVLAGGVGPYSGQFPASLVYGDYNNVAPRVGLAWKPRASTTVRAGYGVQYNLGAYAPIAQNLAAQPPFAVSETSLGSRATQLSLSDAFVPADQAATTNSYGIDKHYQLGVVQVWNLDLQRDVAQTWIFGIGYAGAKGLDLDLERAPNRGPTGLRMSGVEPFLWQSSDSSSIMHSLTARVRKRLARGFSVGASYTFGKSLDDASSIGGGAMVVAQNDLDLAAERGRSSFDRRHRFAADYAIELPFGPGRPWLEKGFLAAILGGWMWNGNVTIQSGPPFTARVVGDFADVASGVNGTLRANMTGQPVNLSDPTPAEWFNTKAFTKPSPGTFGDAGRNTITGPGSVLVNMGLVRNVSLAAHRIFSLRIQANNVFNTPQFTAIDTVVNSPTLGQVVSAGQMRTVQLQARLRF